MSEKDNLQEADGIKDNKAIEIENKNIEIEVADQSTAPEEKEKLETPTQSTVADETIDAIEATAEDGIEATKSESPTPPEESDDTIEATDEDVNEETKSESPTPPDESDDAIVEIEASNAEDAENDTKTESPKIEEKNYHDLSMEDLVTEFEGLLKSEKIQSIRNHVDTLKNEFDKKFGVLLEEKKKEFLAADGNSIDFHFDFPLKTEFNKLYKSYREERQLYYKKLENSLKSNLENRLEIIDEIKSLLNVEENINTTYKHFKALQERWRNAGPIPRDKYNNVWNNYHHHVENFYDFLHLNRDLRDLDFKHNLEQKQKIIIRAEELAQDEDSNRAFRELQALHKMWKEELGPVAKEYREDIWHRFRAATKSIHEKRQAFFEELDKAYVKNLEKKHEIISEIEKITEDTSNNHSTWQKKIKGIEDLRQQFFNAGKVPIKVNEATWAKFKEAVRAFNRKKNSFYKGLKKDQYDNLQKKLDLIKIAEEHKDSTDFETTTPLMKRVQNDWKNIGHVPRKESDKIWNQFKAACNHYFDKLHDQKNASNQEEEDAYAKKNDVLTKLKTIEFDGDLEKNLELIRSEVDSWKTIGRVPFNKRYIDGKFNKIINALYNKLDIGKSELDLLKFDNKIESFANSNNNRLLDNEHNFVRKRIDEIKGEINQLENNLLFFSNVKDDNPVVKDVHNKIDQHKTDLGTWKEKLKRIKKYY